MAKIISIFYGKLKAPKQLEFKRLPSKIFSSGWLLLYYNLFLERKTKEFLARITNKSFDQFFEDIGINDRDKQKRILRGEFVLEENLLSQLNPAEQKEVQIYKENDNFLVQQYEKTELLSYNETILILCAIIKTIADELGVDYIKNSEIVFLCHDKKIGRGSQSIDDFMFSNSELTVVNQDISEFFNINNVFLKVNIKAVISFRHEVKSKTCQFIKQGWGSDINSLLLDFKHLKEINNLKELKNRIINLWLPLTIDIQGLSEIKEDETKAKEYYDSIRKVLNYEGKETDYYTQLKSFLQDFNSSGWQEIEEKLQGNYKNFKPVDLVDKIFEKNYKEFIIEYFNYLLKEIDDGETNKLNPNFLPNWLQEVVNVLDEKIKEP